jgi:hypothetical protein
MSGASIRSKCRVLLVTSAAPTDRARAAIIMSSSPIRVHSLLTRSAGDKSHPFAGRCLSQIGVQRCQR